VIIEKNKRINKSVMIIIKEINFSYYKNEILKFRKNVWEQNNFLPVEKSSLNSFCDEFDEFAFHWAAFDKNNIVALARLSKHNNFNSLSGHHLNNDTDISGINFPIASLSRLVIHKSYQGHGLSERFDKERIAKAEELACNSVCVITYGQRTKQIMDDGFEAFHSSVLTRVFKTDLESKRFLPLAFYYKGINTTEMV
jgi:predicted GNAT family N-acyltransferase